MKRIMIVLICVVFVGCYGIIHSAPNSPPSAPVTVVNTPLNPVPVTGDVVVSGMPDVNVINDVFPGIKVAENRGCNVSFPVTGTTSNECTPGGFKPQVIEQVSLKAEISSVTEGILFIKIRNDSNSIEEYEHSVPLKSINGILFGSQLMRLYVPNGYQVFFELEVDTSITAGTAAARIDFSGYRVQEP